MGWPEVLTQWSFDPPVVIGLILAAALYWRGWRPLALIGKGRPSRTWNALAFYAGLIVVGVALESPIDVLSASLFTFHMIQHLLLIMVAAPLLVLGDPGVTMLRGVPLEVRRRVLRVLSEQTWVHRLGRVLVRLNTPATVFGIFMADLYLWHWSRLFNLTLQNDTVHIVEHLCFIVTAVLFWGQLIDQRALHPRLSYVQRALYGVAAGAAGNVLAMYLVFAPKPVYTGYAHIHSRLYGMTVLGDQQIAGAIMWVPVLFVFGGVFAICLFKALQEDERQADAATAVGGQYAAYVPGSSGSTRT
jgi:cytochrome c oxidase assembly factor CtaG